MYIYQEGCGLIDVAINLFAFLATMSMGRWRQLGFNRIFIRGGCTLGGGHTIFHMEITIINFFLLAKGCVVNEPMDSGIIRNPMNKL